MMNFPVCEGWRKSTYGRAIRIVLRYLASIRVLSPDPHGEIETRREVRKLIMNGLMQRKHTSADRAMEINRHQTIGKLTNVAVPIQPQGPNAFLSQHSKPIFAN